MSARRMLANVLAVLVAMFAALNARADILLGQTSGFTGQVKGSVEELSQGAQLYFDSVNAAGGVNGQRIKLIQLDDKFDPALAAANAETLIVRDKVVALFLTRGTPHTQAVLPLLSKHKVPLVAPSTGAMVLHQPVLPHVFNVRATYQREAMRAIEHLGVIGLDRIAVLHVNDSFGADAIVGARKGLEAARKRPVVFEEFDRAKPQFADVAQRIRKAEAQAVLIIGSATAVADATRALRAVGSGAQVVTLSNNASGAFIKLMGSHARGTVVSQVFPYERSGAPIVRQALEMMKSRKSTIELSPAMLEGFASAKVMVEALKRAGATPTRGSVIAALDQMRTLDIGGMELSYSPTDHSGFDFVDLSIVDRSGRFTR